MLIGEGENTVFTKADQLVLKSYAFLLSKKAGSAGFATEAVMLIVVAALAGIMMLARSAIGQKIMESIAAIGG